MERKTRKHPSYSIGEKNEIAKIYIKGDMSLNKLADQYDVCKSVVKRWINQYRMFGTTVDNRGRESKGRPPKPRALEGMSKDELIERIHMIEDIKKAMACPGRQKKNTG
ncbi:MAG: hypothetical protein V1761_01610 [bacterium]